MASRNIATNRSSKAVLVAKILFCVFDNDEVSPQACRADAFFAKENF
jgi:hypothetical protein